MAKDVLRKNPGEEERESKEAELHSAALLDQPAGPGEALRDGDLEDLSSTKDARQSARGCNAKRCSGGNCCIVQCRPGTILEEGSMKDSESWVKEPRPQSTHDGLPETERLGDFCLLAGE